MKSKAAFKKAVVKNIRKTYGETALTEFAWCSNKVKWADGSYGWNARGIIEIIEAGRVERFRFTVNGDVVADRDNPLAIPVEGGGSLFFKKPNA